MGSRGTCPRAAWLAGHGGRLPTGTPLRGQGGRGSVMSRDVCGLARPVHDPRAFPFSKGSPRLTAARGREKALRRSLGSPLPPGDYTCCDLVVQIKECETREAAAIPGPAPPPPQPAPSEEPETPGLREGCSKCRPAPASSSLTLQVRPSACHTWLPPRGDRSWGHMTSLRPLRLEACLAFLEAVCLWAGALTSLGPCVTA